MPTQYDQMGIRPSHQTYSSCQVPAFQVMEDYSLFSSLFEPQAQVSMPLLATSFPELHHHYETIKKLHRLREDSLVAVNVQDVENVLESLREILEMLNQWFSQLVAPDTDEVLANQIIELEFQSSSESRFVYAVMFELLTRIRDILNTTVYTCAAVGMQDSSD